MLNKNGKWFAPWLVLPLLLLFWHGVTRHSGTNAFFFGTPAGVLLRMSEWFLTGIIFPHLAVTLLETLLSFVVGTILGITLGLLFALSPLCSSLFDPYIKVFNSMPRVILAPIFALWFGLGIWSKVALGVSLVFFIVFFNVYSAVKEVPGDILANVRILGANRRQLLRYVYLPSAASWVFSSLHTSIGMAFVGTVVGEYLGSSSGVGYLILQAEGVLDMNAVMAGVLILTVCSLLLDRLVTLVEKKVKNGVKS